MTQEQVIAAMRKANAGAANRIRNALRVNKYNPICEPSGFAKQAAEIRAEMRKAKTRISAN